MAIEKSGKTNDVSRNQKQYEHSAIDLRFLKAIDLVIKKNKKEKIKPDSDNSVSRTIFGDRSIIGKIRTTQRGVSMSQLEKFAIYFNLDFNCFFRDTVNIIYHPQEMKNGQVVAKNKGIASTGKNAVITQVKGDQNGDIIGTVKGNVYKESKIGQVIQLAESIFNNVFDQESKKQFDNILGSIRVEADSLESIITEKNEELKKMANLYETQMLAEIENRKKAEKERDEAREEERKILKKYLSLIEKKN